MTCLSFCSAISVGIIKPVTLRTQDARSEHPNLFHMKELILEKSHHNDSWESRITVVLHSWVHTRHVEQLPQLVKVLGERTWL